VRDSNLSLTAIARKAGSEITPKAVRRIIRLAEPEHQGLRLGPNGGLQTRAGNADEFRHANASVSLRALERALHLGEL
jgi:hypothetical protein